MHMCRAESVRRLTLAVIPFFALVTGPLRAQSTAIPASSPTGLVQPVTPHASAATSSRLTVSWDGVSLQVDATDMPLSRVLREISSKTKLRITGSAPDERIFGTYGPGPMNLVLPALLDGLPVNMLLTEKTGGAPDDLSLTARSGQPTPASVPLQQTAEQTTVPEQPQPATGFGRPAAGVGVFRRTGPSVSNGSGGAIAGPTLGDNGISGSDNGITGPNNGVNGADNGIGVAPTGTDVNATGTASPNGVRTPQEIFEQLQKLRQQQNQPQ